MVRVCLQLCVWVLMKGLGLGMFPLILTLLNKDHNRGVLQSRQSLGEHHPNLSLWSAHIQARRVTDGLGFRV